LPVFEELNGLLFYPVQYEGLESSPNIFYTGAEPTQQIIPGVEYLLEEGHQKIYLLGSDYVFPRTANTIIKAQLADAGAELAGEEYLPLGGTEFSTIISKIQAAEPDAIFNTLNGDSNVAFFKQFKDAGFTHEDIPVMSVSVAEEEVRGIGPENIAGHFTAWNYYQTTETAENEAFVAAYKEAYGEDRVTADPIEAGYFGVYLWKEMVEKADTTEVDAVREAAASGEIEYQAPEGLVRIDGENQHTYKTVRIGLIREDGLIEEVFSTDEPVKPDPFLKGYDWAAGLSEAMQQ
jgi:urea transport system substrate-binding protein